MCRTNGGCWDTIRIERYAKAGNALLCARGAIMSKGEKRFRRMENNPKADWTIADIQAACSYFGADCTAPRGGGSHFTVSHPEVAQILTIPAHKPIKPVYIAMLVMFIKSIPGVQL